MDSLHQRRIALVFALLLLLKGSRIECSSEEEEEESGLEKCCELGSSWAGQKLRCAKFTGPVPGVAYPEQPACLEAVDICCRKAYQEADCELGKANARAGRECLDDRPGSDSDFGRDCCEGCKLGILTGSSGKNCKLRRVKLGAPWDPAFLQCCNEVKYSTAQSATSTISTSISSTASTLSDNDEFDFDYFTDQMTDAPNSDDLCKIMKGLLCSDICISTPGSYICKCNEGSVLQSDGRSCKSNITTTEVPLTTSTPTTISNSNKKLPTSTLMTPSHTKNTVKKSISTNRPKTTKSFKPTKATKATTKLITKRDIPKTTAKVTKKLTTAKATTKQFTSKATNKPKNSKTSATKSTKPFTSLPTKAATSKSKENRKLTSSKTTTSISELLTTRSKSRPTRSIAMEDDSLGSLCPVGFRFNTTTDLCDDIDECSDEESSIQQPGPSSSSTTVLPSSSVCPSGYDCVNTPGSYMCDDSSTRQFQLEERCFLGYRWNSTLGQCTDVDECSENIHKCLLESENCRNLEGSYECEIKCENGFFFDGNYGACLDINECIEVANICPQSDTICVNTLGSYECQNIDDYQRQGEPNFVGNNTDDSGRSNDYEGINEEDIDECQMNAEACGPEEICRNTLGGYDCIPIGCPRGFVLANETCQDVNECEQNLHTCAAHERCQNTNGSFTCEQPRPTRPYPFSDLPNLNCRRGFKADNESKSCIDVDECVEGPGCRDHERCQNLEGSYDCSPLCGPGWYFEIQTKTCEDVDECLLGHHNCRQRSHYCRNTNGSYSCELLSGCSAGYRRLSTNGSCVDVDECLEGRHSCSREAHRYCVNREGGYECITRLPQCARGFEYSLLTRQCEDVDECRTGRAVGCANSSCVNLPGGYRCERLVRPDPKALKRRPACPAGFTYDPALRKCSGKTVNATATVITTNNITTTTITTTTTTGTSTDAT